MADNSFLDQMGTQVDDSLSSLGNGAEGALSALGTDLGALWDRGPIQQQIFRQRAWDLQRSALEQMAQVAPTNPVPGFIANDPIATSQDVQAAYNAGMRQKYQALLPIFPFLPKDAQSQVLAMNPDLPATQIAQQNAATERMQVPIKQQTANAETSKAATERFKATNGPLVYGTSYTTGPDGQPTLTNTPNTGSNIIPLPPEQKAQLQNTLSTEYKDITQQPYQIVTHLNNLFSLLEGVQKAPAGEKGMFANQIGKELGIMNDTRKAVVGENEFDRTAQAQGVLDKVGNIPNALLNGSTALTANQIDAIRKMATITQNHLLKNIVAQDQSYAQRSQRYGIPFDEVRGGVASEVFNPPDFWQQHVANGYGGGVPSPSAVAQGLPKISPGVGGSAPAAVQQLQSQEGDSEPVAALNAVQRASSQDPYLDAINAQIPPQKAKGRTVFNKTGRVGYISDGTKWIRLKQNAQ